MRSGFGSFCPGFVRGTQVWRERISIGNVNHAIRRSCGGQRNCHTLSRPSTLCHVVNRLHVGHERLETLHRRRWETFGCLRPYQAACIKSHAGGRSSGGGGKTCSTCVDRWVAQPVSRMSVLFRYFQGSMTNQVLTYFQRGQEVFALLPGRLLVLAHDVFCIRHHTQMPSIDHLTMTMSPPRQRGRWRGGIRFPQQGRKHQGGRKHKKSCHSRHLCLSDTNCFAVAGLDHRAKSG